MTEQQQIEQYSQNVRQRQMEQQTTRHMERQQMEQYRQTARQVDK